MRFDFTWNFEFLVDNESKSKVASNTLDWSDVSKGVVGVRSQETERQDR
jgi:hypothetical protein